MYNSDGELRSSAARALQLFPVVHRKSWPASTSQHNEWATPPPTATKPIQRTRLFAIMKTKHLTLFDGNDYSKRCTKVPLRVSWCWENRGGEVASYMASHELPSTGWQQYIVFNLWNFEDNHPKYSPEINEPSYLLECATFGGFRMSILISHATSSLSQTICNFGQYKEQYQAQFFTLVFYCCLLSSHCVSMFLYCLIFRVAVCQALWPAFHGIKGDIVFNLYMCLLGYL